MDDLAYMDLRLEQINETHNVTDFDSMNALLNEFLRDKALEEQRNDLSRTYLLIGTSRDGSEDVIGYFALHADFYYSEDKRGIYSLHAPVIQISYLARHIMLRGQKVGSILMLEAFRIVAEVSAKVGVTGIHLTPTGEGRNLYSRFRFIEHVYGDSFMFLPISTVREFAASINRDEV